jgi:hypothetical protein
MYDANVLEPKARKERERERKRKISTAELFISKTYHPFHPHAHIFAKLFSLSI